VLRYRVIPVLTIDERRLVKTIRFRDPRYLGDPLNAVRLFNEKEVDEIVILDIGATRRSREPDFAFIADLASECFMPMAYGGGIVSLEHVARVLALGVEKVVMNTAAVENPSLLSGAATTYGNQAVVASIDVRRRWTGTREAVTRCGTKSTKRAPAELARAMAQAGAGELLLTSVEHDGQMHGYDLELIREVTAVVSIPVIACGGAGNLDDLRLAVTEGGASAASAGSLFVYQGKHRAVLVSFPSQDIRDRLFA
jgi:cyclase